MNKRFLSTWILLGVLTGLILWYQLYEKRYRPQQVEAEGKEKQLISLAQNEIQELTIERMKNPPPDDSTAPVTNPEYEVFQLKKAGGQWNLTAPLADLADEGTVSNLVSTLATLRQDRVVDDKPKDLEPYGLKFPLLKITVRKDSTSPPQTVLVGKNTPVNYNTYAQIAGKEAVLRAPRSLRTSFDKSLKDLRNKKLFALNRGDVTEVEFQTPKGNFVVKRENSEKEEWTLARDLIPADGIEWTKTLTALTDLSAKDFASEKGELARFGLQKPLWHIWISKKGDTAKQGLLISKVGDKVYAKREDKPVVIEIDKEVLNKFHDTPDKYRSLRIAAFNRFEIKHIRIELGGKAWDLVKDDAGWSNPTAPSDKIDSSRVDTWLTALQDARLEKYLMGAKAEIKAPEVAIHLYDQKEATHEKVGLRIAKLSGKSAQAVRTGLTTPFTIKEDDYKKINLDQKAFLQTEKKTSEEQAAPAPEKKS